MNSNQYFITMKKTLLLFAFPLLFTGCYHAQISTGLEASTTVYQQAWASSFIAGLVPPKPINAQEHCSNGVAKVETRHSFLNMLAQMITFSLYSPMEITVTCAAGSADLNTGHPTLDLAKNSSEEVTKNTFGKAAALSAESDMPVYVRFN